MRKFKPCQFVTPKEATDADRRLVYYARYYFDGTYVEFYRGKRIRMEPGMVGIVRSIAPSVMTSAPHVEFLVIDFCHPITGKVERAALHHSEVEEAEPPEYEIPRNGWKSPEAAFTYVR
jgi:hypothetical protein